MGYGASSIGTTREFVRVRTSDSTPDLLGRNLHLNGDSRWFICPNWYLRNMDLGTDVEIASELPHWTAGNLGVFVHQLLGCHWSSPDFRAIRFQVVSCTDWACWGAFVLAVLQPGMLFLQVFPWLTLPPPLSLCSNLALREAFLYLILWPACTNLEPFPVALFFPLKNNSKKNSIVPNLLIHCIIHFLAMFNVCLLS